VPFDPEFTIYVWFDALLTYITGIGYGDDEATFRKYWPCDTHFIGKDITRFHCALWPAMLWAAGEEAPKKVFAHGFVYVKDEESGAVEKISKSLGNVVEPMEVISKFSAEAFRYFFLRECPFPSDGEFGWSRFAEVYNSELANNLGNLLSRCVTLLTKNYEGVLTGIRSVPDQSAIENRSKFVDAVVADVKACRYNSALQLIIQDFLTPTNQTLEHEAPWKLVKTDKPRAAAVLYHAAQQLRVAAILLKPFIPESAETIYKSFNFPTPWDEVTYAEAARPKQQEDDLRVTAKLGPDGKVPPLFPRIG
jgi:methionyl-tRNA synthetase